MATTLNPYFEGNSTSSMINDDRSVCKKKLAEEKSAV
jgi:hypothetical protein